jgi:hypothetical protein
LETLLDSLTSGSDDCGEATRQARSFERLDDPFPDVLAAVHAVLDGGS